jgi:hypothetical protein
VAFLEFSGWEKKAIQAFRLRLHSACGSKEVLRAAGLWHG